MAKDIAHPLSHPFLTDADVEEFRVLAREHAGAELSVDQAKTAADQLLRVLAIVREIATQHPQNPERVVDNPPLPAARSSAINSNSLAG